MNRFPAFYGVARFGYTSFGFIYTESPITGIRYGLRTVEGQNPQLTSRVPEFQITLNSKQSLPLVFSRSVAS